jgi:hypothetical protein
MPVIAAHVGMRRTGKYPEGAAATMIRRGKLEVDDQANVRLIDPKALPTPVLNILHAFRGESVQTARANTPK